MDNIYKIQEEIKQFILKTSYISADQVNNDTLIFAQGIMDSMGFISIIAFIEENYSIKATDNELIDTNFESVSAITDFVLRKMNQKLVTV